MNARDQRGKNTFKNEWLGKDEHKDWLQRKSSTHARCILCQKDISVQNMGEAALTSHAKPGPPGKPTKHERLANEKKKAANSLATLHFLPKPSSSTAGGAAIKSTIKSTIIPLNVTNAEIRWVLKVVRAQYSCLELN